ncbi:PDZ domain-containing protein [Patescibacteria group bacterium]|nr:PDZ domain-containing protein [Patescibacteria group bacterium]
MKKIKFFVFTLIITITSNTIVCFADFVDVQKQSLYYDAVNYFTYEIPIIDQASANFRPLNKVTKAEFFKMILASAGYNLNQADTAWYEPYVQKAEELNIITSLERNNFNPGDLVTRAEGLKYIFNLYKTDAFKYTNPLSYTDVKITDSYAQISQKTFELQLLSDYKSKEFIADKPLTRADIAHILYGIHKNGGIFYLPEDENSQFNTENIQQDETFKIFVDVLDTITTEYIEKDSINREDLIYAAITAMVNQIGDPYSIYLTPTDASYYQESLDGNSFAGIGIYLSEEDDGITILTPLKGSPAEKAGLKPNDIILEVDGVSLENMGMEFGVELLRGEIGTYVKLKILRDGKTTIETRVKRDLIVIPYVETEMIDSVGVIHYYQFTGNSHSQFQTEITKLLEQNPKGLILDLRNNPGGYLYSSKQLLSHFTGYGETIATLTFADGSQQSEIAYGDSSLKSYPIVILLNEGSASAAEIVALALRDLNGTKIVGKTSYGKGKIQEIITYNDGSSLKLSNAKWYSPNGTYINKIGIKPDYEITITEQDFINNRDTQLEKALSLLK